MKTTRYEVSYGVARLSGCVTYLSAPLSDIAYALKQAGLIISRLVLDTRTPLVVRSDVHVQISRIYTLGRFRRLILLENPSEILSLLKDG